MPVLSYVHQLFNAEQCQAYIHRLRWKDRPLHVLAARATTLAAGARTNIDLDANATGAIAASAPSTTSPLPCCTRPSGHCRTGYSRPFCSASPVRHGALPGKWASISVPAIAGAGGCAMPRCPMRCSANWRGRWKPMTSITPPATRGKQKGAGRRRWDASHVAVVRNASPGVAIMTRTGPPLSRGSAARELSSSRRPAISPSRRCKRPPTLPSQAGSRLYTDSASSYRALKGYVHEYVNHTQKEYARGDVHENRAECLFSLLKPYLRVFRGVSNATCQGMSDSFSSCGTFANAMPLSRPN